jgi:hypothetical protein
MLDEGNKTKGSIKERSPGYFKIILDVKDASGKRRRKWHSFKGHEAPGANRVLPPDY